MDDGEDPAFFDIQFLLGAALVKHQTAEQSQGSIELYRREGEVAQERFIVAQDLEQIVQDVIEQFAVTGHGKCIVENGQLQRSLAVPCHDPVKQV